MEQLHSTNYCERKGMGIESSLLIPVNHPGTLASMPAYLSTEWLAAAATAVADDPVLQQLTTADSFVLQQEVTDATDPTTGTTIWHVVFSPESVELLPGAATSPDVTLRCDADTAHRIHQGHESAQQAFMEGRLQLGGDPDALLRHQELLSSLTDALAPLRPGAT